MTVAHSHDNAPECISPRDAADTDDPDLEVDPRLVGPVFRGDWAFGEALVDGAGALLAHEGFIAAAGAMFQTEVVVPEQVYVNLTTPLPRTGGVDSTVRTGSFSTSTSMVRTPGVPRSWSS